MEGNRTELGDVPTEEIKQPLVSVIVLNHNGLRFLDNCLDSILKSDYPRLEVILVDNNSSDPSASHVEQKFKNVSVLRLNENYHFAGGNNRGANSASGDVLFFLNNDTVIDSRCISLAVSVLLSSEKIGIVQSNLIEESRRNINTQLPPFDSVFAQGAGMFIRRAVWNRLDGFDADFRAYVEDADLGIRARLLGYDVYIVPASVIWHYGSGTVSEMRSYFLINYYRNFPAMMVKNFGVKSLLFGIPLYFAARAGGIIADFASGKGKVARMKIIANVEFLRGIHSTLAKRKLIQKSRVAKDTEILRYFPMHKVAIQARVYEKR